MTLKDVAKFKYPGLGDWIFGKEIVEGYKNRVHIDFDHLTGDEPLTFFTLAKIIETDSKTVQVKLFNNRQKFSILTKSKKKYWVLDENENPNKFLDLDSSEFSNIGGKMKVTKSELISFAESLTEALETVAEKIEAIEDIINGEAAPAVVEDEEEVIEDDVDVEDDYDEDEDDYEDEDDDYDEDEDEEVDEDDESDKPTEEDFSKRYSKVKNFLTL